MSNTNKIWVSELGSYQIQSVFGVGKSESWIPTDGLLGSGALFPAVYSQVVA